MRRLLVGRAGLIAGAGVVIAALVVASTAGAQTARQKAKNPQQPAGQQPPAPVVQSPTIIGDGPFLRTLNGIDWTVRANLNVLGGVNRVVTGGSRTDFRTRFELDSAVVVFPMMPGCANGIAYPEKMTSELSFENQPIDTTPVLLDGYADGTRLARWGMGRVRGKKMRLHFELPMSAWELEFNEAAAMRINWPTQGWPVEVQSSLSPSQFIESNDPDLFALLMRWTKNNPRSVRPAMLAKALAAEVVQFYQPDNQGYLFGKRAAWAGFEVQGAAFAVRQGIGSPFNMSAMLCAMYRAAGLPARVVIGYDAVISLGEANSGVFNDDPECKNPTGNQPSSIPHMTSWVEFYLYDEKRNVGQWIPVNVVAQRRLGSKAPPLRQSWKFFGNFPCGEHTLPLAFQFHPPTTVVSSGPPTMWGWLPEPLIPITDMWMHFDAMQTPKRLGD